MSAEETTRNFWEAWNNFQWPEPQPIEYRLYYNDDGSPQVYTMENLPGNYILVTREEYIKSVWNVRVVDGRLEYIVCEPRVNRLIRDDHEGTPCHPHDVCIVIEQSCAHQRWRMD